MTASLGWPPMWGILGSVERPSLPWQASHWAILSCRDWADTATPAVIARAASAYAANTRSRGSEIGGRFSYPLPDARCPTPDCRFELAPIRHAVDGAVVIIRDQDGAVRLLVDVHRPAQILVVLDPARYEGLHACHPA